MAIIDSNQTTSNNVRGFEKGIHATARTLMLDNLQSGMYNKPIQSAVRECVSNAVDSVKEKILAIDILKGTKKVEDHYVSKDSVKDKIKDEANDIYSDSEFDPNYYDLKYLDKNNAIELIYKSTSSTKKDQFIIHDRGVGLGGKRLEGFFNLGYSTKRLNSNELGGFGLGAKSPLSTGVDSFRIKTCYNGKEFCFDIYSHKVDCVYSQWNEDGTKNQPYEFETIFVGEEPTGKFDEEGVEIFRKIPYKAYCKDTNERNSLTISIDVRKHNKNQYFEAVKSQLMYLTDDITFKEIDESGNLLRDVPFKADILYEDDLVIIPRRSYYSKPHFVIKNIGYGLIDYNEMDLSVKQANVGVKISMEKVEVTPNRESVIYRTKTRNATLESDTLLTKRVSDKIEESLKENDFVKWLRACNKVMFGRDDADVLSRLSDLVDRSALAPKYKGILKFGSQNKTFLSAMLHTQAISLSSKYDYTKKRHTYKVSRTDEATSILFNRPIYLQFGNANSRITGYLSKLHSEGVGIIKTSSNFVYLEDLIEKYVEENYEEKLFRQEALNLLKENITGDKLETAIKELEKLIVVVKVLKESSEVKSYSKVQVPEEFKFSESEEESEDDSVDYEAIQEAERKLLYKATLKLRKENKAFLYEPANKYVSSYRFQSGFIKEEIKYADLDFENRRVIYGTEDESELFNDVSLIARSISSETNNTEYKYFTENEMIVKVAKNSVKYFKDTAETLSEFVLNVKNNTLTTYSDLRNLLTVDFIKDKLKGKCQFLNNFSNFSDTTTKEFLELKEYIEKYDINYIESDRFQSTEFKLAIEAYKAYKFILANPYLDEDAIQGKIDDAITNANALDLDLDILELDLIDLNKIDIINRCIDLDSVYGSILNHVTPLCQTTKTNIPLLLENEIRSIIDTRKDQLNYEFEGINK